VGSMFEVYEPFSIQYYSVVADVATFHPPCFSTSCI
jgi:hypothetical protein